MAKKEDVMGTGIGARPPAMQSRKQVMPGRMQKPMQPQYGAQQNMRQNMPQYGGMQNMQPGGQPMRPASAVMPRDWQESQQPRFASAVMPPNWQQQQQPRPTSAVMPMQGLNQAMMQMLMGRK
jgi:hypothetical protein